MELPLTHPEYYEEMGIKPPKGVILYGAPGTGECFHGTNSGSKTLETQDKQSHGEQCRLVFSKA